MLSHFHNSAMQAETARRTTSDQYRKPSADELHASPPVEAVRSRPLRRISVLIRGMDFSRKSP